MAKSNKNRLLASLLLVGVVVFCEIFGLPGSGLTRPQEITACILLIAATLWVSEWVSLFVVSFLILALQILWLMPALNDTHVTVSLNDFYSPFFSNIILLFLGGFVLSAMMQRYGLDIRFAQVILRRSHGKPGLTLLGIILACAFLSMWISNTATTAMMLTIVFPLLKKIPDGNAFRKALVLSIPFACNIGGIGTPIGTPPNAIALSYLAEKGYTVSFLQWMILSAPFLIAFLALLWFLLMKLYPARDLVLDIPERIAEKMGPQHWGAIVIFLLTALGWFSGSWLGLKTGTVALLPIIAAFWFGLLDTGDFRKLPWDILYIVSGGMALGVALNISGLGAVLVGQISLDSSPFLILAVGAFVAGLMSTVMSNTATAGLIIPLVMSLQLNEGFLMTLVLALAMMCSMAMALPVTTPPNAIAFSSRAIKSKDMMLTGGIITLVGLVAVVLFGPVYWQTMITILFH